VRRLVLVCLAAAAVLSACGGTERPATEPRVKLTLKAPSDGSTTRADQVELRGTVTPADAAVAVKGEAVQVEAGEFVVPVKLEPGGNVIDVTASAAGRRPASDALRLARDMTVDVPDVLGQSPDDATAAIKAAGLTAETDDTDNWLGRLFGDPVVCSTRPAAKTAVDRGTKVVLTIARDC